MPAVEHRFPGRRQLPGASELVAEQIPDGARRSSTRYAPASTPPSAVPARAGRPTAPPGAAVRLAVRATGTLAGGLAVEQLSPRARAPSSPTGVRQVVATSVRSATSSATCSRHDDGPTPTASPGSSPAASARARPTAVSPTHAPTDRPTRAAASAATVASSGLQPHPHRLATPRLHPRPAQPVSPEHRVAARHNDEPQPRRRRLRSLVNGQVAVPAGGQVNVSTPRVDQLLVAPPGCRVRASRMR